MSLLHPCFRRPSRRAFGPLRPFVAVAAVGLASCAGDVAAPPEPALLHVMAGDAQQGLVGEPLFRSIVVRVTDSAGRGVQEVTPDLATESGSASAVATDFIGRSAVRWRLGGTPGEQTLRVSLPNGAEVQVSARALLPEESDVVVFPEGTGAGAGVVFVAEHGALFSPVWSAPARDGRVILPPQAGGEETIVVFAGGRPLLWSGPWTPGPDSLFVPAPEPVRLDLAIFIQQPPLETLRQTVQSHLARLEATLASQGVGIALGEVVIREAPTDGVNIRWEDLCALEPASRILVYYVGSVDGEPGKGYACGNRIAMGSATGAYPGLLAHELGHLLGLRHTSDTGNVMHPRYVGPHMTAGQIFRAHYHYQSAVNTVAAALPPEEIRNCDGNAGVGADPCFDESYELPFGL